MSPSPSTANEVQHLYQNFKTLQGSLEYFEISRGKQGLNTYGNEATLIYNPSLQLSQSDPFNGTSDSSESSLDLVLLQNRLTETIRTICAIPRYSFIENDKEYMNGEIEIPYKYRLNRDGLKYEKQYAISPSTVDSQFSYISSASMSEDEELAISDPVLADFKRNMRHNFQKFHKFDHISFSPAISKINELIGRRKLDPHMKFPGSINYHDLMDLSSSVNRDSCEDGIDLKLQRLTHGFTGFSV